MSKLKNRRLYSFW